MSALTADEPAVLPLARQPPRTAALPSFPSPITMRHRADSTADSTAEWLANSQQTSEVVATALRLCSSARRAAAPNTWPRSRGRWAAHTRPPARMGAELREWRQRRSETIVPSAASGIGLRQQGRCWAGVPEQYQRCSCRDGVLRAPLLRRALLVRAVRLDGRPAPAAPSRRRTSSPSTPPTFGDQAAPPPSGTFSQPSR